MENKFYVYILRIPELPDPFYTWRCLPFYIGKGSGKRVYNHKKEALRSLNKKGRKSVKINIIHKLWKNNLDYKEEVYKDNLTEQEVFDLGIKLIGLYGRIDNNTGILANMTDGGQKINGMVITEEIKERKRGFKNFLGKKHTDEAKKKISISQTIRFSSVEEREKLSAINQKIKKQKAFEVCGHEDWLRCKICGNYDDPINMYVHISKKNKRRSWHRERYNKFIRDKRKGENKDKPHFINGMSKLNPDDIDEIRKLKEQGLSCSKIANKFQLSSSAIWEVCVGKTWKWVV
jgi:hypothetical protein